MNDKWWDRYCTECKWKGTAVELIMDETAESFYRCPDCGKDSDETIEQVPWHRGDKVVR